MAPLWPKDTRFNATGKALRKIAAVVPHGGATDEDITSTVFSRNFSYELEIIIFSYKL